MSSKFTATRHTRARPPVCRAPLRGGIRVTPIANPTVLIAAATWIDTPGVPSVSIGGQINLYETLPDASWTGSIEYDDQTLAVTVTKTPGSETCSVAIEVTAEGIPEGETYPNVPCTPDLCGWHSPLLITINTPDVDWHSVEVWA